MQVLSEYDKSELRRAAEGYLYRFNITSLDWDDLVQVALSKYLQSPLELSGVDFIKWMKVVMRNYCIDILRDQKYEADRTQDVIKNEEELFENRYKVTNQEEIERIVEIILELPRMYKKIIYDYFIAGLSPEEISKKHKKSMSCIRTRIFRGRLLLREKLRKQYV